MTTWPTRSIGALGLAGLLLASAAPARAEEITIQGCASQGVEPACVVIKADGRLFDISAAQPKPEVGTMGRVTGTISQGVSLCMQGVILKPATWTPMPHLVCPKQDQPGSGKGN